MAELGAEDGAELIANGSNFIRGYDPRTGAELWRLGGSSKITAPTLMLIGDADYELRRMVNGRAFYALPAPPGRA